MLLLSWYSSVKVETAHMTRDFLCVCLYICSLFIPSLPESGFKTQTMQDVAVINFLDYLISFQLFKGLDII